MRTQRLKVSSDLPGQRGSPGALSVGKTEEGLAWLDLPSLPGRSGTYTLHGGHAHSGGRPLKGILSGLPDTDAEFRVSSFPPMSKFLWRDQRGVRIPVVS